MKRKEVVPTFRKKCTRLVMQTVQSLERNHNWKSYHSFLLWSEQAELLPLLSIVACPGEEN